MNPAIKTLADTIKKRKAARLAATKFPSKTSSNAFKMPEEQAIVEDAGNETAPTEAGSTNDVESPIAPGIPGAESVEAPAETEADAAENIQGDAFPAEIESEIPVDTPANGSAPDAETAAKHKKKHRKKGKTAETAAEVEEESV